MRPAIPTILYRTGWKVEMRQIHKTTRLGVAALVALCLAVPIAVAEDGHGPDRWRVTGVGPDDVLNIRSGPGARHDIVGRIPPDGRGLVNRGCRGGMTFEEFQEATPEERERARFRRWCRIEWEGIRGWVNGGYLREDG